MINLFSSLFSFLSVNINIKVVKVIIIKIEQKIIFFFLKHLTSLLHYILLKINFFYVIASSLLMHKKNRYSSFHAISYYNKIIPFLHSFSGPKKRLFLNTYFMVNFLFKYFLNIKTNDLIVFLLYKIAINIHAINENIFK